MIIMTVGEDFSTKQRGLWFRLSCVHVLCEGEFEGDIERPASVGKRAGRRRRYESRHDSALALSGPLLDARRKHLEDHVPEWGEEACFGDEGIIAK